ncbi:MAG: SelB C-terminal domain-containing protein, partial [Candidatus Aminicenantes bacterium]|nr:SelB C-terminal domain-containing protein [Candidatus Aminicenantes bacterium]
MPLVELRSKFLALSSPEIFSFLLAKLNKNKNLIVEGTQVTLPGRSAQLTHREAEVRHQIETIFFQSGLTPPLEEEIQNQLKAEPAIFKKALHSLYQERKLIRLSEKVILHHSVWAKVEKFVLDYLRTKGKITIAELRDELRITRKYACAILEFMDHRGLTRRKGDEHVLK